MLKFYVVLNYPSLVSTVCSFIYSILRFLTCSNDIKYYVHLLYLAPANFDQTTILSTSAYGFLITWDSPATPNGLILNYTIILQCESIDTVLAVITEFNVTGLMPFSDYNISIKACNTAGCVTSFMVSTTTDEAGV